MMTSAKAVFVDTNVLLRWYAVGAPLHQEAFETLDQLWDSGHTLWVSRQVIREYLVQISRDGSFFALPTLEDLEAAIQSIMRTFAVADETEAVTRQLLLLMRQFPTGGNQVHDANIVATMLVYGIDTLVTHNIDDMKRFQPLITIIPIG